MINTLPVGACKCHSKKGILEITMNYIKENAILAVLGSGPRQSFVLTSSN